MARILLADDDVTVCDVMRRLVEAEGHTVDVVHDGAEALERLSGSGAVDALITDVNMPGLDGISLAGKALASRPGLRVLLMSGFPEALDRARQLSPGKVATLGKPFTLDAARASLRGLMS